MTASGTPTNEAPLEASIPSAACPLDSILCTEELNRRPSRPPEFELENKALVALVSALADSPQTILQALAGKVLEVLRADSAGLSLLTTDEKRFYWAAIAGAWSPHIGGGTPRGFGPCGDVLDRCTPMLFTHWERRYPYLSSAVPLAEEGLLVPFYVNGKAVGTIWAIAHENTRRFDAEDLRLLESMGHFASAAYQAVGSIESKQKRTESALRRSEAFLTEAQRLSATGAFSWRVASSGMNWSEETYRILEFERGEPATIERMCTRVHPEDISLFNQIVDRARNGAGDIEYEHRLLMPDDSVKYLHLTAHGTRDNDGQLEYIGALQDVTQRRLSEQDQARRSALRAEISLAFANEATTAEILARCVEAIVRHLDAAFARIWTLNQRENVLELRASGGLYTHLDGRHSRVPVGKLKIGLIAQEKKPYLINDILNDPRISDKEWARRNGMVAFAGYPLIIEDRLVGVLAMFSRNRVTAAATETLGLVAQLTAQCVERKRAEETLTTTQAELARVSRVTIMGELAASIAHEVNQPLTAIVNNANACLSLMPDSPGLAEVREALAEIIEDAARASAVVAGVRQLVRKAPFAKTQLSLRELIAEVSALARYESAARHVTIRTEFSDDLLLVLGDRAQLQQVLLNLVFNGMDAMKATEQSKRIMTISGRHELHNGEAGCLLSVKDAGVGFEPGQSDKLFKAFYTTKPEGMGMGLAISRSIVEAHGGRLWAEANPGAGATFLFTLPAAGNALDDAA